GQGKGGGSVGGAGYRSPPVRHQPVLACFPGVRRMVAGLASVFGDRCATNRAGGTVAYLGWWPDVATAGGVRDSSFCVCRPRPVRLPASWPAGDDLCRRPGHDLVKLGWL